jgi:hypothetical protein
MPAPHLSLDLPEAPAAGEVCEVEPRPNRQVVLRRVALQSHQHTRQITQRRTARNIHRRHHRRQRQIPDPAIPKRGRVAQVIEPERTHTHPQLRPPQHPPRTRRQPQGAPQHLVDQLT